MFMVNAPSSRLKGVLKRRPWVVALFVVRKDPALTEKAVIEYTRQSLAGYKVPKHVYFKKDLPKSNVGKILRKTLREELAGA